MKKRLAIILLSTLMLLAVVFIASSCEDTKIERAVERTEDLDKYEATLTLKLNAADTETKDTVDIKVKDPEVGKSKEYYKLSAGNSTIELFKENGWYYSPSTKSKISQRNFDETGINLSIYKEIIEETVQELPDGLVNDASITEDDGEYTLSAKLTSSEISDDYEDIIALLKRYYGLDKASVESAEIRVVVEKRYVEEYELIVNFKTDDGQSYKVSSLVEYDDPGDRVKIEFPKGYEDYKEAESLK